MKKLTALLLLMLVLSVVLLGFSACNTNDEHVHAFGDATCTTPATCECGATEGEALGHTYESEVTAPTHTAAGYTTYTCSVCKDTYTANEVAATGHSYESVVTAPTCTAGGYTTYTCACGDTYVGDEVAATGHSYESVVTAPTCTAGGYTTYTCACGDTYTGDEVAATGHSHEANVTAPTCTAGGYTTYTCACGDSYTGDEVAATGHSLTDGTCTGCGGVLTAVDPIVDKPYFFGMTQGNLQNKVYYLKGGMNGYYMETTTNPAEALAVYLEATEGGYYAYCYVGETKTYINMVVSGTHVNGAYEATAKTVYTIDEAHNTIIGNVSGDDYWFGTRNDKTYTTAGPCKVSYAGFYCEFYEVHTHAFEKGEVTAPGCETEGYTTYNCACGATEKREPTVATGHNFEKGEVTAPGCETEGYTTYNCACGATEKRESTEATGHKYVDGVCSCGAEDPSVHKHKYVPVVTAPTCTVGGYTTYTCACGDTYTGDETEPVPHVDTNLDITCDFEGCTKRILPPADSKVSLFTANNMIIVSLSSNYYVEGVVTEITDAKNGIFIIEDEAGDSILVRLPKNAAGVAYASWTDLKVVVGDTVQVYGKPAKNNSAPTTEAAKIESGVLTVLKHTHSYSAATCTEASTCACLAVAAPALGHVDTNNDGTCDRCPWNMNNKLTHVTIATDPAIAPGGVLTEDKTSWTWTNDGISAVIAKGTSSSTLYTTAKAYMQLKKLNTLTVSGDASTKITSITIYTTNATQLANLKDAIGTAYEYTVDEAKLSVTINFAEPVTSFVLTNAGKNTAYISGVDVITTK